MKRIFCFLLGSFFSIVFFSQASLSKEKKNGWHLYDEQQDGYMGISLQKAYELLKGRKSKTVIVAVIDSAIDTAQEDLKAVLWTNEKEISSNGIDDDKNGYVDDVYGWNFCGSPDGENLVRNSYEIARVYHGWKNEFEGKKEMDIPADRRFLYGQWIKAAGMINKDYEDASKEKPGIINFSSSLEISSKVLCDYLSSKEFNFKQIKLLLGNPGKEVARAAAFWNDLFKPTNDSAITDTAFIRDVADYLGQLDAKIDRKLKGPEDWRGALTKDNYTDINDRFYGNNNLKTGSGNHGTMVAGTIGAIRNNGIGVDSIADNVRI